ncbi:unknown [Firmicutes bacterium CAG:822]|nr:unknown [Firmicutes bacterium CAG:822]
MKKVLILLIALCLTGCIVRNEDFESTCEVNNDTENISDNMSVHVTYDNEDIVKKAVVTRTYKALNDEGKATLEEIKTSATSFNEKYAGNENIKITVAKDEEDEWQLKYYLDVPNLDNDVLNEFMLRKNSVRFFNKMQDENIECD